MGPSGGFGLSRRARSGAVLALLAASLLLLVVGLSVYVPAVPSISSCSSNLACLQQVVRLANEAARADSLRTSYYVASSALGWAAFAGFVVLLRRSWWRVPVVAFPLFVSLWLADSAVQEGIERLPGRWWTAMPATLAETAVVVGLLALAWTRLSLPLRIRAASARLPAAVRAASLLTGIYALYLWLAPAASQSSAMLRLTLSLLFPQLASVLGAQAGGIAHGSQGTAAAASFAVAFALLCLSELDGRPVAWAVERVALLFAVMAYAFFVVLLMVDTGEMELHVFVGISWLRVGGVFVVNNVCALAVAAFLLLALRFRRGTPPDRPEDRLGSGRPHDTGPGSRVGLPEPPASLK